MARFILILLLATPALAGDWESSGSVGVESRWFFDRPQFDGQLEGGQASLLVEPHFEYESEDRDHQLSVRPHRRP